MRERLTEEQESLLERIAEEYNDMLIRYCARCVSYNTKLMPLIPDVIQETYLKAVENVDTLLTHQNIPGWLKKSCHYSLLNMIRNVRSSREIPSPAIERLRFLYNQNSNNALWRDDITLNDVLDAVVLLLSEEDQIIFNDYFLDDLSTKETAVKNHMGYDVVRGKISRIRKKLKEYFSKEGGEGHHG